MGARRKSDAPAGHLTWIEAEDAVLRRMMDEGRPYAEIAKALGRSVYGVKDRAHIKGWRLSAEAVARNRRVGRERFQADPERVAERSRRIRLAVTAEKREALAELARQRNLAREFGVRKFSAAGKRRVAEGVRRYHDTQRLQWLPRDHPLRPEYHRLVRKKGAAAAACIIKDKLSAVELREIMRGDVRAASEPEAARIWCSQCDRQVAARAAAACGSSFCAAKRLIREAV